MNGTFEIQWIDAHREPTCLPDLRFPAGVDLDCSEGKQPSCVVALQCPAKRCGAYYVQCLTCGVNAMITTAGRIDDPKSVRLPCKGQESFIAVRRKDGTDGTDGTNKTFAIPADKNYPADAVQCDGCGGHGCSICDKKGWLPAGHPEGRKCLREGCGKPIPPTHVAVYCSNDCALKDYHEGKEP